MQYSTQSEHRTQGRLPGVLQVLRRISRHSLRHIHLTVDDLQFGPDWSDFDRSLKGSPTYLEITLRTCNPFILIKDDDMTLIRRQFCECVAECRLDLNLYRMWSIFVFNTALLIAASAGTSPRYDTNHQILGHIGKETLSPLLGIEPMSSTSLVLRAVHRGFANNDSYL